MIQKKSEFLSLSLDKGDTHEGVLTFAYTDPYMNNIMEPQSRT